MDEFKQQCYAIFPNLPSQNSVFRNFHYKIPCLVGTELDILVSDASYSSTVDSDLVTEKLNPNIEMFFPNKNKEIKNPNIQNKNIINIEKPIKFSIKNRKTRY